MNKTLSHIKKEVYDKCGLELTDFRIEPESKEYDACRFELNEKHVICRSAKITPKKQGQFVTFWKRKGSGPIEPFDDKDRIDLLTLKTNSANLCCPNRYL